MASLVHVLIIDDDAHIRELLRYALEAEGLTVMEAQDGRQGLEVALKNSPQLLILDVMMPEMNGLDVCRELRKTSRIPILFLSSRDTEIDKIIGLELGGDDYVSKPFSPRELVARVKAMLRRQNDAMTAATPMAHHLLRQGAISLYTDNFKVLWKDLPVVLTNTEFNLLQLFLASPKRCFSRDALCQADIFRDIVSDRTIDSHIRRLRHKFSLMGCQTVIDTVHGFGYQLGSCL